MGDLPHVIEVALLVLVAFVVGCAIGAGLRRAVSRRRKPVAAGPAIAVTPIAGPTVVLEPVAQADTGTADVDVASAPPAVAVPEAIAAVPDTPADDLRRIKGLGPKARAGLEAMGIVRFAQIAAWSDADIERIEAELKIKGRIRREAWVEQARGLVAAAGGPDTGGTPA